MEFPFNKLWAIGHTLFFVKNCRCWLIWEITQIPFEIIRWIIIIGAFGVSVKFITRNVKDVVMRQVLSSTQASESQNVCRIMPCAGAQSSNDSVDAPMLNRMKIHSFPMNQCSPSYFVVLAFVSELIIVESNC